MVLIWCNNPPACALLVLVLPSEALVDDLGHVLDCLDIGHSRDEQSLGVLGDLGWRLLALSSMEMDEPDIDGLDHYNSGGCH